MLVPNHVYISYNAQKTKQFIPNISDSDSIEYMFSDLRVVLRNNNNIVTIELFNNLDLLGIIEYDKTDQ